MDLSSLYQSLQPVSFLHSRYYVEGCLLGACACPEIPLPDVWLPWVIKEHNQIQNAAQADEITDKLFAYFKYCLSEMHKDTLELPDYAYYTQGDHQKLSEWCTGLLTAHSAREQFWQGAWNKMQQNAPNDAPKMAKDLKHCLSMFSTFADPKRAIGQSLDGENKQSAQLVEQLPTIAKSLPQALHKYIAISGELAAYLPNQFETFEQKN